MKKRNYILIGIVAILLCVVGGVVGATFSRYTSTATATPQAQVAKWKVKVNETEISKNGSHTFNPTITWTNALAANGVMAPGSTGTITFTLDGSDTQVPIIYNVAINTQSIKNYSQISIKSVTAEKNSEGKTELKLLNSTENEEIKNYTGNIELDDINSPLTITINLEWKNDDENNQSDTTIGSTIEDFDLPITVTASQKVE